MFRYLALVWNASQPRTSASAQRLGGTWQRQADWRPALRRPGLQVFTTGERPGINEAQVLHGGLGLVLGKLFRRVEFDATPAPGATLSEADAKSILDTGGRALVEQFWGRYVAFLPAPSDATVILRDPSGSLPCFKLRHGDVWIYFSWLEDALQITAATGGEGETASPAARTVNWDLLAHRFLYGAQNGRETALTEITQVLPGELVDSEAGTSTLLWSAVSHARAAADRDGIEAATLLGHAVRSCTRSWASCYDTLLLRLSGGVDSSILVSCLAAGQSPSDVICINYYSPGSDTDERRYAMLAAGQAGRDLLTRERDPAFRIQRVLASARMPNPVTYVGAMNAATDAKLAAAYRAGAMFTGAGGDPLFYEMASWWPAADYLRDRGWDPGFLPAALDAARVGRISLWRCLKFATREHVKPDLAARTATTRADWLPGDFAHDRVDGLRFAHPELRAATDLPIGKYMQTAALMHPIGYYDPFEQAAAPEAVHPLFSQPLVELCLRLPTYLLIRGGRGRALARRAFAAELPKQIAARRSKGGTDDHIKAVLQNDHDFVCGLLLDGHLVRRGFINRARLEAALRGGPTTLDWSPGLIHELVAVEAWLTRWLG
ncbi:hypothetical protein LC605_23005 [Nostoc sp. CHAB 5836]|nr:hypothetical protein [Nostoc sp. CHAB 5836]